jgi:hypothetical protein
MCTAVLIGWDPANLFLFLYFRRNPEWAPNIIYIHKAEKYTDNKGNQIFLIFKEMQSGAVAKSYMRKGFLI